MSRSNVNGVSSAAAVTANAASSRIDDTNRREKGEADIGHNAAQPTPRNGTAISGGKTRGRGELNL
jgi:hypothetical protein